MTYYKSKKDDLLIQDINTNIMINHTDKMSMNFDIININKYIMIEIIVDLILIIGDIINLI